MFYPLEPIQYPPTLPVPIALRSDEDWPGVSRHPYPPSRHTSKTFPVACRLMVIAQEVNAVYSACKGDPVMERVPLAFLEAKYQKILACIDTLKNDVVQAADAPLYILVFQYVKPP